RVTAPKIVTRSAPSPRGGGCGCSGALMPNSAAPGEAALQKVEVLEAKRVAGYDAVILKADAPGALTDWLKDHGYESSPVLTEWATPYVKAGWMISAFK